MLSEKKLLILVTIQFFFIVSFHVIYSFIYCTMDQTINLGVWFICVLVIYLFAMLLLRKQTNILMIILYIAVLATTTYYGYELETLSWAIIIFFVSSMIISTLINLKYTLAWSILSMSLLISYAIIWPGVLLKTVPSLFMYFGYLLAYIFGQINELMLVYSLERYRRMSVEREQNLRADNDLKSIFWNNITNEIKTPMNVINGMSRLLKAENLNARAVDYTEQIENASSMLLSIVTDTLELTEIETGNYQIDNRPYDLYKVVSNVIMEASERINDGIDLVYCINPIVPTVLIGDPDLIYKVLIRMVKNAVGFVKSGEIRVEVNGELVGYTSDQIKLKFIISDTGGGVEEEALKSFFTGFEETNSRRTVAQEYVGLSLKVCKTIINELGGDIDVSSELGVGTKFYISLTQETGTYDLLENNE